MKWSILAKTMAILICFSFGSSYSKAEKPFDKPTSLLPTHQFDFSTSTDLKSNERVLTKETNIEIGAGGKLTCAVNSGGWCEFDIDFKFPEKRESSLRIRMILSDSPDCYVQLKSTNSLEKQPANISMYACDKNGEARKIRFIESRNPLPGSGWKLSFRYGLLQVRNVNDPTFELSGAVPTFNSRVKALEIESLQVPIRLISLTKRITYENSDSQFQQFEKELQKGIQTIATINTKKPTEALKLANKIKAIWQNSLGPYHPHFVLLLFHEAQVYEALFKYPKATEVAKVFSQRCEKVFGNTHPFYATSQGYLATTYIRNRQFPLAKEHLTVAKEIHEHVLGKDDPQYATCLNNLASVHSSLGDYDTALSIHHQALQIRKDALGTDHPEYAQSLCNLGLLQVTMRDFEAAEASLQESAKIIADKFGTQHPEYAESLHNLGGLYQTKSDFIRAHSFYQRASDLLAKTKGKQNPLYAESLERIGSLYKSMGDITAAERHYTQAAEIRKNAFGETHPAYNTKLNNVAIIHARLGNLQKAQQLLMTSVRQQEKVFGLASPQMIPSLVNAAALTFDMGEYQLAEKMYRIAMSLQAKHFGRQNADFATCLNNVAGVYQCMGRLEEAERYFQLSLDIRMEILGKSHPDYSMTLRNLANLKFLLGQFEQARLLAEESLRLTTQHTSTYSLIQSERQQLLFDKKIRSLLNLLLSIEFALTKDANRIYGFLLNLKGTTFQRQRAYRQISKEPKIDAKLKDLKSITRKLSFVALNPPKRRTKTDDDPRVRLDWQRRMERIQNEKEDAERELARMSQGLTHSQRAVTPNELRHSLPQRSVLLDFFEYWHRDQRNNTEDQKQRHLSVFIIRPNAETVLLNLGPSKKIENAIRKWRETVLANSHQDSKSISSIVQLLGDLIWKPILPYVEASESIFISADGELGTFPFAVLPGRKRDSFLVEDFQISYVAVPRMIPQMVKRRVKPGSVNPQSLLVIGDIAYGKKTDSKSEPEASSLLTRSPVPIETTWLPLAGTKKELNQVAGVFQKVHSNARLATLSQREATKTNFMRMAPEFANLHIASHGFFAPPRFRSILDDSKTISASARFSHDDVQSLGQFPPGVLSGLVLVGANARNESNGLDGILTADEIASLRLQKMELVVLSACDTGIGRTAGGEGLLGMQRAFQIAGANTTIATLWQIGDESTPILMNRFYQNIWIRKMTKARALQEAQIWMIRNYNLENHELRGKIEKLKHPARDIKKLPAYYWAAFVLSGDWQ